MSLLGLDLDNILKDVIKTVDNVLGGDQGDLVDDLCPGKLINSLGNSLDGLLTGGSHGLFDDLLDANVLDTNLLNNILSGKGGLDLHTLDGLLSGDTGDLGGILDDVFDDGLLGIGTSLNLDALLELDGSQLGQVTTFVTSLVATILKATGDVADIEEVLDGVLSSDDKLRGDGKDNLIDGRRGDDTIYGHGGDDTLVGNHGHDVLKGGGGDDVLHGGVDGDILYGGKGDDIFLFGEDHSGFGPGARDVIKDFGKGDDALSFADFGTDLDYVGKQSFSGDGHAEIAWKFKGDFTLIKIDIDGDAKTDFAVELTGRHHLSQADFIL